MFWKSYVYWKEKNKTKQEKRKKINKKDHKMEKKKISWGQKLSALPSVKNIRCMIIWCKIKKKRK